LSTSLDFGHLVSRLLENGVSDSLLWQNQKWACARRSLRFNVDRATLRGNALIEAKFDRLIVKEL